MAKKKLRVAERESLARLHVLVSAGRIGEAQAEALRLLSFLDWARLPLGMASFEREAYCHQDAIRGHVLCDGAGRCLATSGDLRWLLQMLGFAKTFARSVELGPGLWPLEVLLMCELESTLKLIEGLNEVR